MNLRISKLNLVQSAMEELLNEVKVRDWEEADDVQVQEAMHKVMHWENRKLKIGESIRS